MAALTCLAAVPVAAAPPEVPLSFAYQGLLLDDQGQAQTGTVDLTLRLYDALSGGTLVYVQGYTAVPLTDGVFTIQLGPSGNSTGGPLTTSLADALSGDVGATGPARFVEITVGTEGALARTQILAAPYALRAESAASADQAATALDTANVDGVPSAFVSQLFEHGNSDDSGPVNSDPREGLADTDLDGVANFVDPDNDNDGLDDSTEIARGSDINLVTPVITGFQPTASLADIPVAVKVLGTSFEPGISVSFGAENPTPSNVTSTSFDVALPAQSAGTVGVQVTRANGESDSATYDFVSVPPGSASGVTVNTGTQLSFDVFGALQTLVGGVQEYGADLVVDGIPDLIVPYLSSNATAVDSPGQFAVAWDPTGRVAGLRCAVTGTSTCDVELNRDINGNGDLNDDVPTVLEGLVSSARIVSPSLTFDSAGAAVAGYVSKSVSTRSVVAHDRDGDGDFDGVNELVPIESFSAVLTRADLGEVAVDGSDRPAYVYWRKGNLDVRLAYDRSGDGDFDDAVGGNPELLTVVSGTADCLGLAFDPNGHAAVAFALAGGPPQLARDQNGDGDFSDAGEVISLPGSVATACDVASSGTALAYADNADGELRLLVDRNGDGDFDDVALSENVLLESSTTATRIELQISDTGRAVVVTDTAIFFDPIP